MSTNSGNAPVCEIASVVAMKVCGTVTTTSPGPTPQAIRAKRKGVGAAANSDCMVGFAKSANAFSNSSDHWSADKAGVPQGVTKHIGQLLLKFNVRSNQIQKGNRIAVINRNTHFVTSIVLFNVI